MHNTGGRWQGGWENVTFGTYTFSLIEHFIHVNYVNLPVTYFPFLFQVRLGTEKGAQVVKGAVLTLYALLVAFGLSKALPLTCIVCTSKHNNFLYLISDFPPSLRVLLLLWTMRLRFILFVMNVIVLVPLCIDLADGEPGNKICWRQSQGKWKAVDESLFTWYISCSSVLNLSCILTGQKQDFHG